MKGFGLTVYDCVYVVILYISSLHFAGFCWDNFIHFLGGKRSETVKIVGHYSITNSQQYCWLITFREISSSGCICSPVKKSTKEWATRHDRGSPNFLGVTRYFLSEIKIYPLIKVGRWDLNTHFCTFMLSPQPLFSHQKIVVIPWNVSSERVETFTNEIKGSFSRNFIIAPPPFYSLKRVLFCCIEIRHVHHVISPSSRFVTVKPIYLGHFKISRLLLDLSKN